MNTNNDRFKEEGYVAIKGFMSEDEIQEIGEKVEHFIETIVPGVPPEHVFYEEKGNASTLKQLQHLDQYAPYFNALFHSQKIIGLAESLLGAKVTGKNIQWFNKPPGIGKETPPHQDGFYFMLEPNEAVTMWLALDYVDEENGCVRYIPGSHKKGMRPHGKTGVLGFSQGIIDYNENDSTREVPMIVEPGDLIAHHSMTIHRADGNPSNRTRKGLGFIFYSSLTKEDKVMHEQYQKTLKEELLRSRQI